MRNFIVLISTLALFAFTACTGNRLKARTLQVDSASFEKLQLMIPKLYWVDQSGRAGDKYVAFRSRNNTYLSCNQQGEVLLENHLNRTELWTPEILDDKKVALKHINGKYLGLKNETFRCDLMKDNASHIKFELNPDFSRRMANFTESPSNLTSTNITSSGPMDKNQTIAFHLDNGYLGLLNRSLVIVPELNLDSVFMPPMANRTSA